MILNKWEESIIVKGKGSRKGTVMIQIVNECTELYEVCKQSVKDGCSIKNRKTRSCYQIGFLDSDKNKPFKHNKQEYNNPPMDQGKPDDGAFGEIIDNFTGRTYNYI